MRQVEQVHVQGIAGACAAEIEQRRVRGRPLRQQGQLAERNIVGVAGSGRTPILTRPNGIHFRAVIRLARERRAQQIAAFQHIGNGLLLNGSRRNIAFFPYCAQQGIDQVQFFKLHNECELPQNGPSRRIWRIPTL